MLPEFTKPPRLDVTDEEEWKTSTGDDMAVQSLPEVGQNCFEGHGSYDNASGQLRKRVRQPRILTMFATSLSILETDQS
jgi:hypothetical protein